MTSLSHGVTANSPSDEQVVEALMSQVIGLMVEVPLFMMTIWAISFPISFQEYFGEQECTAYSLMFPMSTFWGTICGFIMAVYRLTCVNGKRYNINYFVGGAFSLMTIVLMNAPFLMEPKTNPGYQFCIGKQLPAITMTSNLNESIFDRILRARVVFLIQALILSEFMIYLYILKEQEKSNKKHLQEKIISKLTFQVRKKKNLITLNGQICIFATRMALSMLAVITKILKILDVNDYLSIVVILFPCIIALTQVLSSHEMRRYLKSKFE